MSSDPFFKSFFPKASSIIIYEHFLLGESAVEVDGVFKGYLQYYNELYSFVYFVESSYKDFEDLQDKYFKYLSENEKYSWLP